MPVKDMLGVNDLTGYTSNLKDAHLLPPLQSAYHLHHSRKKALVIMKVICPIFFKQQT